MKKSQKNKRNNTFLIILIILLLIALLFSLFIIINLLTNYNEKKQDVSEMEKYKLIFKDNKMYKTEFEGSQVYYYMMEGRISDIKEFEPSRNLFYKAYDVFNMKYKDFAYSVNKYRRSIEYDMYTEITTYSFIDYANNIKYSISYNNANDNMTCTYNLIQDCNNIDSYQKSLVKEFKSEFVKYLKNKDISFNKLKSEIY